MDKIFFLFFLIFIFFIPVQVILNYKYNKILKKEHKEVWESLGSPGFILNNSLKSTTKRLKFLWRKKFLNLKNNKLSLIGRFLIFSSIIYHLAFFTTVCWFIFIFFKN